MKEDNSSANVVLVDSDAFVGLFYTEDAHHEKASSSFEELVTRQHSIVVTSFVVAETATVLSYREGQDTARQFLNWSKKLPIIHITEELQSEALALFEAQTKKGTSVIDCANVIVMKRLGIERILSFDGFYKKFKLKAA